MDGEKGFLRLLTFVNTVVVLIVLYQSYCGAGRVRELEGIVREQREVIVRLEKRVESHDGDIVRFKEEFRKQAESERALVELLGSLGGGLGSGEFAGYAQQLMKMQEGAR